jgi:hypothetical protein
MVGARARPPRGKSVTPERVGGCLRAGREPVGETHLRIGTQTEDGSKVAREVGDAHTAGVTSVAGLARENERAAGGED